MSGPQFRLRPSVEPFVDREGELCFVRPGGQDLVVHEPSEVDVALARELMHGWQTAHALADRLGLEVSSKLEALVDADLVVVKNGTAPPLGTEDAERFSRQLLYLSELGDDVALQRRLRESTVVVIGCGGLGTWAVAGLACIGVGHLRLVDDDRVSLDNLNRQILYARDDVGTPKVVAAERWIRVFDPAIRISAREERVTSADDVATLAHGADAVILAADWPPYELARQVNSACIGARVPFLVAGQLPPLLKIGPTYIPGVGPCFACHETALARMSKAYEDYVAFRASEPMIAPTIGPGSAVAGGLMSLELLHLLTGQAVATTGVAMLVDMRTLTVRHERFARDPQCRECKHVA